MDARRPLRPAHGGGAQRDHHGVVIRDLCLSAFLLVIPRPGDAELLALAIAKNLLRAQSLWLQGNRIGPVGLNSLALGLRKAPETSPLRSLSLGGNEFHRALDAPAADVRARRSRRKAERALARAQQAARHRKVVLRPHS